MGERWKEFFDLERIIDPRSVKDTFATRLGYIEALPGGCLRAWYVIDHPVDSFGMSGACELTAKLIMPIETMVPARPHVTAWLSSIGFAAVPERQIILPFKQQ